MVYPPPREDASVNRQQTMTSHVEGVGHQAAFFLLSPQHSVLIFNDIRNLKESEDGTHDGP
jgi:hypothetical protein